MKTTSRDNEIEIVLSRAELVTIANCLNEALEIVHPGEFFARVGAERRDVIALHGQLSDALDRKL